MKDSFEFSLLESGEIMKRGMTAIIGNVGRAVAIITLIVSALVLFTDIGFADFGAESFTSTLAVMLTASYLMYFSTSDSGERLGEDSEEYRTAAERVARLSDSVGGEDIPALRDFCKRYSEDELSYRFENLLMQYGYGRAEYEEYRAGKVFDRRARRAFRRAERLRAIPITPKTLLSSERRRENSELASPENRKLLSMILRLIPTTVCMTVTVSVILTAKDGLSAGAVIDGIFKLASLLVIGFKGYAAGYCYTRHTLPLWLDTKARLLDAFLKGKAKGQI